MDFSFGLPNEVEGNVEQGEGAGCASRDAFEENWILADFSRTVVGVDDFQAGLGKEGRVEEHFPVRGSVAACNERRRLEQPLLSWQEGRRER